MAVSPEKIGARPSSSLEQHESKQDARKEQTERLSNPETNRAALDTMASIETSESTNDRVSEALSEMKDQDLGGGSGGAKAQFDPAKIKEELLKKAPNQAVMMKQIEVEIKKEIKYLHRRAMRMITRPGEINYFEMNNMLKKLRELKRILKTLIKASLEGMRTLWLRFVHGVM